MRKSIKLGVTLMTVGTGSAVVSVDAAEHGAPTVSVTAGLLSGALTALGATTVIVGWATRRPAENSEA